MHSSVLHPLVVHFEKFIFKQIQYSLCKTNLWDYVFSSKWQRYSVIDLYVIFFIVVVLFFFNHDIFFFIHLLILFVWRTFLNVFIYVLSNIRDNWWFFLYYLFFSLEISLGNRLPDIDRRSLRTSLWWSWPLKVSYFQNFSLSDLQV